MVQAYSEKIYQAMNSRLDIDQVIDLIESKAKEVYDIIESNSSKANYILIKNKNVFSRIEINSTKK